MQSVSDALSQIIEQVPRLDPHTLPLGDCLGLVLAEDIVSSTDSPPFDKALMDGYAVRCTDVADGVANLECVDEIMAGQTPSVPIGVGQAALIMTGAPVPDGADAVVRIEDTRGPETAEGGKRVQIESTPVKRGQNVMLQGTSLRRGQRVLAPGHNLRPQDIGALAELGYARVRVIPRPRVAVLATGDELVGVDVEPGPGQIRNSNEAMLTAQIARAGGTPVPLGIARDTHEDLKRAITEGLDCDMLLLSGGVSAGKLDLVPQVLAELGVREVFHKVRVKPGKPIWFGLRAGADAEDQARAPSRTMSVSPDCVVFGLPGNPVSSLVCFELFVRAAIRRLAGVRSALPRSLQARLSQAHIARGDRPTYYPAAVQWTNQEWVARPVNWRGSADLCSTVAANAMIVFPAGDDEYPADTIVDVLLWQPLPDEMFA